MECGLPPNVTNGVILDNNGTEFGAVTNYECLYGQNFTWSSFCKINESDPFSGIWNETQVSCESMCK